MEEKPPKITRRMTEAEFFALNSDAPSLQKQIDEVAKTNPDMKSIPAEVLESVLAGRKKNFLLDIFEKMRGIPTSLLKTLPTDIEYYEDISDILYSLYDEFTALEEKVNGGELKEEVVEVAEKRPASVVRKLRKR